MRGKQSSEGPLKFGDGGTKDEIIISADSHVLEPDDLWIKRLPSSTAEQLPPVSLTISEMRPGATDPRDRLEAMVRDGVSMEVLYPTRALTYFRVEDPTLQRHTFRIYNDWLAEYCGGTPGRLVGIPAISTYDVDKAIEELQRCSMLGLKGAMLWHVPPEGLSYSSDHYDRLWAAISETDEPVSLHILTGFSYSLGRVQGVERYRASVNLKLIDAVNVLFDFIFYGVFERFPRLKLVMVEFEVGWLPWVLQQWDYYVRRFKGINPPPIGLLPSEYFDRQVYATFFNDPVGTSNFARGWGVKNCMWSSDFPHPNTTWPHSRETIARDLGRLDPVTRSRLVRGNVLTLYKLGVPVPVGA